MAANPGSPPPKAPERRRFFRDYWARVTEGAQLDDLGRQFLSEAKASYRLYAKDVDWDEVGRGRGPGRFWRSAWALFQAMLMKLSPARRVLLLIAIVLLVFQPDVRWGARGEASLRFGGIGIVILFVLLAVELADRVTMKRDLEIAREIQQWLVPESAPKIDGIDIAFSTRPQNTVAGDYYDAFIRPAAPPSAAEPPLLVVVADVAGKSVPAALLMATFQASLSALAATPVSLGEIVDGLDRYCRAHSLEGRRFTTAFLAEIDPRTRQMNYVNAGHNDPVLRRASGSIERLSTGGPPFGIPLAYGHADRVCVGARAAQARRSADHFYRRSDRSGERIGRRIWRGQAAGVHSIWVQGNLRCDAEADHVGRERLRGSTRGSMTTSPVWSCASPRSHPRHFPS